MTPMPQSLRDTLNRFAAKNGLPSVEMVLARHTRRRYPVLYWTRN